jgi:hypothetical protein
MKYYVYELINPIDGNPFYVGKGSGRRMYVHEFRAKRSHAEQNENRKLRNKIKSILNSGKSICYKQIFFTDNDVEAYTKETEKIKELGIENLCNVFISPPTLEDIYKLNSIKMMGHITTEKTKKKISSTLRGHFVSDITRKKIGDSCRGKRNPCTESKRINISKSRRPKEGFRDVISPLGERFSISILTDFCKKHNLHLPSMSMLLHKKIKSHRKWRLANSR